VEKKDSSHLSLLLIPPPKNVATAAEKKTLAIFCIVTSAEVVRTIELQLSFEI